MVKVQLEYLHIFLAASLKVTSLSSFLRLVAFKSKLQKRKSGIHSLYSFLQFVTAQISSGFTDPAMQTQPRSEL